MFDVFGVYLVDFGNVRGAEFAGKHYAVVLSSVKINGDSLLVAPMTSKKKGKKYRGGFTVDTTKYQMNPKYEKVFVRVSKICEVDKNRIYKRKIYDLDEEDRKKLVQSILSVFSFLET